MMSTSDVSTAPGATLSGEGGGPDYQYWGGVNQAVFDMLPTGLRRVLDIGGGDGGQASAVKAHLNADCAGVFDLSEVAARRARDRVDFAICGNVEQAGAIEAVFAQHGPFDLILCLDVLEHLVDPWRLIARLHSMMPVGGYVLASIPNVQNYRAIIRTTTGTWRYKDLGLFDRTHLRYFGRRSAIELMTCTGLELKSVKQKVSDVTRDRWLHRLTGGLLGRFLTLQYQILVRKTDDKVRDPGSCGASTATA